MSNTTWNQIRDGIKAQIAERRERVQPIECLHLDQRFVQYALASGVITLRKQCTACNDLVGNAHKRADVQGYDTLPVITAAEMEKIRAELWSGNSESWQEQRDREQRTIDDAFWAFYQTHLKSDLWRVKRHAVLRRANGLCEGCGIQKPDHVHHRTYENLGDEFLFELVALCEDCHQRIHPHRELKKEKNNDCPF